MRQRIFPRPRQVESLSNEEASYSCGRKDSYFGRKGDAHCIARFKFHHTTAICAPSGNADILIEPRNEPVLGGYGHRTQWSQPVCNIKEPCPARISRKTRWAPPHVAHH